MNHLRFLALAGLLLVWTGPACTDRNDSAAEQQQEANRDEAVAAAADSVGADWQRERDEMRAEWDQTRTRLDEELAEVDRDLANAKADTRAGLERRRQELRDARTRLDTRLSRWGQETEDQWRSTRNEVRDDLRAIGETLDRRVGEDNTPDGQ